jgi:hypothetical protein
MMAAGDPNYKRIIFYELVLYDLASSEKPELTGKFDGFVFRQHGSLENPTGFAKPSLAQDFINLPPSLKPYLGDDAFVVWSHCYGMGRQDYLDAMMTGLGVESIKVSSGPETYWNTVRGPTVGRGGTWIDKPKTK